MLVVEKTEGRRCLCTLTGSVKENLGLLYVVPAVAKDCKYCLWVRTDQLSSEAQKSYEQTNVGDRVHAQYELRTIVGYPHAYLCDIKQASMFHPNAQRS